MDLFAISPIDFLVKPLIYEKLKEVIIKFFAMRNIRVDLFTYKWGRDTYKIKIGDIIYLKVENRLIKMFTTKKDFRVFYGKLKELYTTYFNKYGFLYIHSSTLANYSHVTTFEYDHLIMSNGEKLQISHSKRKEVRNVQIELEKRGLDL
jgi:DNA-binding LytR/AlgR family response regulator